jgi:DNA-binding NarL/FixJ family response regulator
MNGLTLAQRLVAIHPQVKIVMSTGFADVLTPEEMTGVGIKKLLLKPVLRHDLAVAIRSTLDE